MQNRKVVSLSLLFFLLSFLIWGLGLRQDSEWYLQYLVFATQLLYGGMMYDLLKSMRSIPSNDIFWNEISELIFKIYLCFAVVIGLLWLAAKMKDVAFIGVVSLLVAIIVYFFVFSRMLPKLQPLYAQARVRNNLPNPFI